MSSRRMLGRVLVCGFIVACGCIGMAPSAFAATTLTVQFQPNKHWAQEVDTISRYDSSRDYSVAIGAGQTLQINLVTRDPNVFFKVKNETADKRLVDTYKTGATTWSTRNATAATYLIHVYVQPEAMQRDEKAKYALQIGQYNASDLQPATTAVAFQANSPWAQYASSLDSQATAHDYTVKLDAGMMLRVNLLARDTNVHFKVDDQTVNKQLVDTATTGATSWTGPVASAATYKIQVYAAASALPPGQKAGYTLQIGHYAGTATQPGSAGTAAPAAAGSAPAPATTTGGV
ncbi:MAG TPA: hypothetical protein VF292_16250 [Rhodanobacteraceae bacterium]